MTLAHTANLDARTGQSSVSPRARAVFRKRYYYRSHNALLFLWQDAWHSCMRHSKYSYPESHLPSPFLCCFWICNLHVCSLRNVIRKNRSACLAIHFSPWDKVWLYGTSSSDPFLVAQVCLKLKAFLLAPPLRTVITGLCHHNQH